jgi:hypothetical protein
MELSALCMVFLAIMSRKKETNPMPILLWLVGVPLSLVVILMLVGVVHF